MSAEAADCAHCGLPVPERRRREASPAYCCFGCRFASGFARAGDPEASSGAPSSTLLLRLGLGIFLALNIMVVSWLSYSGEIFGDDARARGGDTLLPELFSYAGLFLCTVQLVLLGMPLLAEALAPPPRGEGRAGEWRRPRLGTRTLILVGVFAAYLLSAVHTLRGSGSLYYDTTAVVLVVVALGSYLEAGAKRRASAAARRLLALLPATLWVRREGRTVEIDTAEARVGDRVRVRPGETVPVDGVVVEGASRLDESSLTGESRPRAVEAGGTVLAGASSLDGQLWVRAESVGESTVLALMERALERARASRPRVQRLADRVAAVFVTAVVLLALTLCVFWSLRGAPAQGLLTGLAVLLISCPCALGLAAPLACWHGLRRAAEWGVLVDSALTLERAAAVDRIFFDKTGTLTRPRPRCGGVALRSGFDEDRAVRWAAALESASTHPIARAILDLARRRDLDLPTVRRAAAVPGLGVKGEVDGSLLLLGSAAWAERRGWGGHRLIREAEDDGAGSIFLMTESEILARFDLREELRPGAAEAVAELQWMEIGVGLLSGDSPGIVEKLGAGLSLPAEGGLLPEDKVRRLQAARQGSAGVAMVGDGLNDAPVLAAADLGIAVGSASDLARWTGNVRLLSDRLDRVPFLLRLAQEVRRKIRLNLVWAFGFNSIGIVLAATGRLTPVFAGIAMVVSSLVVIRISSSVGRGIAPRSGAATDLGGFGTEERGAPMTGVAPAWEGDG